MAYMNVAHEGFNRKNAKYLRVEIHLCPDCGQCCEHGIYEQRFDRIGKLSIVEDCFCCKNTRVIQSFRNGVEVPVKTNK